MDFIMTSMEIVVGHIALLIGAPFVLLYIYMTTLGPKMLLQMRSCSACFLSEHLIINYLSSLWLGRVPPEALYLPFFVEAILARSPVGVPLLTTWNYIAICYIGFVQYLVQGHLHEH
jgi:hypothetical protein